MSADDVAAGFAPGVVRSRDRTRTEVVVTQVALRDLLNEALITICLVFSVAAVLTPILLLTSVKVGFIDRLRQEFIEDPSFRAIGPGNAELRPSSVFEKIAEWPGVVYAIPTVLMSPREVAFRTEGVDGPYRGLGRLVASTATDPLLRNLEGAAPAGDGVVMTRGLAEEAGLSVGNEFHIVVNRIENDRRTGVRFAVVLVGIVPTEEAPVPSILADPAIDQQVEAYRSGIPVPDRGWAGTNAEPTAVYSRLLVNAPDGLGATLEADVRVRIGAREVAEVSPDEIGGFLGDPSIALPDVERRLLFTPGLSAYSERDVSEANAVLSNSTATAYGLSKPRSASILGSDLRLVARPSLAVSGPGNQATAVRSRGVGYRLNDAVSLPATLEAAWIAAGSSAYVEATFQFDETASTQTLAIPLRVVGFTEEAIARVSPRLLGQISRGEQVNLAFDPERRQFVEKSAGFRGFRIVAENIDRVPEIVERLEQEGLAVRARSDQILKLQRLERSLNLLVAVVASVALLGGVAILTSSFFANVQRKRVDYATLRLIGMPKWLVAFIPIIQAAVIAALGYLVSVLAYFAISTILNGAVAAELNFEGQLSLLFPIHFIMTALVVFAAACLSSLVASRAATRIDPAEALRTG